jgi:phytoene dehydrogenase-like protein
MSATPPSESHYDVIIIGSGLGALSTASIMAQVYNKRVLVLERHYVVGGFTHVFKRPDTAGGKGAKYEWDVGVHYVGFMGEDERPRRLFDFVTGSKVKWNRMEDPFEKFHYPDFDFEMHGDPQRFRADLVDRFPKEAASIDQMFRDVRRVRNWSMVRMAAAMMPRPLRFLMELWTKPGESFALQTTHDYLANRFEDPKLRGLMASQWGTYALAPKDSSFLIHALVFNHFLKGGYYPDGGASQIAKSVIALVEEKGGKFLINHTVKEIIVEDGKAVGVEVTARSGGTDVTQYFHAPAIVSNIGAYNTYAKFLPGEVGQAKAKELEPFLAPLTLATVNLGLKTDPRTLGFRGENHWVFDSFDHDHNADSKVVLEGKPRICYASFPSLKDTQAGSHTAEILGVVDYDDFQVWAGENWQRRAPDYDALKTTIADGLIGLMNRRYPGFADLIDHVEVSSPLTVEHFTDHPRGAVYGLASTPARFRQVPVGPQTPIAGLFLTGADALMVGVVPVLVSGLMTAGAIMGPFGFLKVVKDMRAHKRALAAADGRVSRR